MQCSSLCNKRKATLAQECNNAKLPTDKLDVLFLRIIFSVLDFKKTLKTTREEEEEEEVYKRQLIGLITPGQLFLSRRKTKGAEASALLLIAPTDWRRGLTPPTAVAASTDWKPGAASNRLQGIGSSDSLQV